MNLRRIGILLLCLTVCLALAAQNKGKEKSKDKSIIPHVKAWRMVDDYTRADTTVVDTIVAEHQVNDPLWRHSVAGVTLGNLGSPGIATFYPAVQRDEGNIFYNAMRLNTLGEEDFVFYNTLTPYANLTYQKSIPKRTREELFKVLYTQNINKRANFGANLVINSSIGRYANLNVYATKFGMFGSFDGDYYHAYAAGYYQRYEIYENGGIKNDTLVLKPEDNDYDKSEDIPVLYTNASNLMSDYRYLFSQNLDLGTVTRTEGDSVEYDVPVATAYHKLYVDRSESSFRISDLSSYGDAGNRLFPNRHTDPYSTFDGRKYLLVSNIFQLRLNEEFNSLLLFGLRAYIGNDIRKYNGDAPSEYLVDENEKLVIVRHRNSTTRVSTYVGGQIFKNLGPRLHWNAGLRFVIQGYNVGDFKADGRVSLKIGNGKWATEVWGTANLQLRSPSLWEECYTSNNYAWDLHLSREKSLNIEGGLNVPDINLEVSVFSATLNDRIYISGSGIPDQKSGVTQVLGLYAHKHFRSRIGFNSIIRAAVQKTSDNDVVPAPAFALFATNFWEHKFFGVLQLQLGFDVRFNTRYYSPSYIPDLMQFVPQDIRETGGYGYFDPYLNFHLKKIRAYLKCEHINNLWGSKDHFHTVGYPANPQTVKFGLSWNFYD